MSDRIYLEVAGRKVEHFLSYSVEADIYVADHAFSLELANPGIEIKLGQPCKLYVNDRLELTGVIEHRVQRTDKSGRKLTIEGRDLMGQVVDAYCEQFITVENMKLSALAQLLLKDVPFINRKQIVIQQNLVGKVKTRRTKHAAYGLEAIMDTGSAERIAQIHPGMTKFQVLQMYALSRGQMFYSLPDGTFVFGRPRIGGEPEFTIVFNGRGEGNNATVGEVDENIGKRYSKVTVIGQQQGNTADGLDTTKISITGTVTDPDFPFYKPFVQLSHNDSQTPKQHARLLLDKMRYDGQRLTYELPRHSPDGINNYSLNRLAQVKDDVHNIHGTYLVSGRTFKLDKGAGPSTTLRLSPPGLVEDGSGKGAGRK